MKYFETIKCENFDILNLHFHEKRVMNTISKNYSLGELIHAPTNERLKCKIIYDEDEILSIEFTKYKKRKISSFKLIVDDNINYSKKALKRDELDFLFSQKEKADEIIIIKNGFVSDTSIANIAIFDGDIWLTPKTPLLKGTVRARLLDEKKIFEKDISVSELKNAKRFALMNAMIDFDEIKNYSFLS